MLFNTGRVKQRGAALVVGLLPLLVLTLLAVAGMNSAAVEFVMAGNEQYRQNAFQAAETGIAQAMQTGNFNPGDTSTQNVNGYMPGSTTDQYKAQIACQVSCAGLSPIMWTGSLTNFSAYHFEIVSTGTTTIRSGTAQNTQGVVVISPKNTEFTPTSSSNKTLTAP